jgi:hypothetical protein
VGANACGDKPGRLKLGCPREAQRAILGDQRINMESTAVMPAIRNPSELIRYLVLLALLIESK